MQISDNLVLGIIAAIPPTLVALGNLWVSIRTARKVEVVHKATNSLTERLIEKTASDSEQKGHTAGVQEEKQRQGTTP